MLWTFWYDLFWEAVSAPGVCEDHLNRMQGTWNVTRKEVGNSIPSYIITGQIRPNRPFLLNHPYSFHLSFIYLIPANIVGRRHYLHHIYQPTSHSEAFTMIWSIGLRQSYREGSKSDAVPFHTPWTPRWIPTTPSPSPTVRSWPAPPLSSSHHSNHTYHTIEQMKRQQWKTKANQQKRTSSLKLVSIS